MLWSYLYISNMGVIQIKLYITTFKVAIQPPFMICVVPLFLSHVGFQFWRRFLHVVRDQIVKCLTQFIFRANLYKENVS